MEELENERWATYNTHDPSLAVRHFPLTLSVLLQVSMFEPLAVIHRVYFANRKNSEKTWQMHTPYDRKDVNNVLIFLMNTFTGECTKV